MEKRICTGKGSHMAQTKSKRRVQEFGEVFTAQREVNAMCDLIPAEMYEPERTWLEPACGEGVFLLEVLRRKFARCKKRADYSTALRSVYGIDLQGDNVEITIANLTELAKKHYKPSKDDLEVLRDHIIQGDGIKIMKLLGEYNGTTDNQNAVRRRAQNGGPLPE